MSPSPALDLDQLLAEYVLGYLPADDLRAVATDMLVAGHESVSLAALAGAERDASPIDLRDLFERALREMNLVLPDRRAAGSVLKVRYARRVASGDWAPRTGAERIVFLVRDLHVAQPPGSYVGEFLGVAAIVGLYYSFDDIQKGDLEATEATERAIVRTCERVARGEDANNPI